MFRRGFFFFALLLASVVVPYVTSLDPAQWFSRGATAAKDAAATLGSGGEGTPAGAQAATPGRTDAVRAMAGIEGAPVSDLGEVIRFDATPAWVVRRWSRVSTAPGDPEMQGYRVAVVTGTREDDLAGSLTYYFNKQQRVQRITFQGTTGDARRLVSLVTSRFGFERQMADPSVHLYQVRWNGKPLSELQIRPARVVRANAAHARYEVALEINNQSR